MEASAGPDTERPRGATDMVGAIEIDEILVLVVESTLCDTLFVLTEAAGETIAPLDNESELEMVFEIAEEAVV
jgi:hypothetical protein